VVATALMGDISLDEWCDT